ncbi:MAG: hypothetical protein ACYS7Y_17665, partial [Planctomycetota bacterium]
MEELVEIAKKLREGANRPEVSLTNEEEARINNAILELSEPDLDEFVDELLGGCDDCCSQFYDRVSNLQFYIGFG